MIKSYIKIAFRSIRRRMLFTFINIIGLTIGISAALVIYLIIGFDYTFDNFHNGGDRIYRVVSHFSSSGATSGVTASLDDATKNEITGIEKSAPINKFNADVDVPKVSGVSQKFKNETDLIFTDQRYFEIFSYKWLAGNYKTSLKSPFQVVLSAKQARKYFPLLDYHQMIGRSVVYDDSIRTTVTGIVQDFTENSDFTFHDFISLSTGDAMKISQVVPKSWKVTNSVYQLFILLNRNEQPEHVVNQMNNLLCKNASISPTDKQEFRLQGLHDIHFNLDYEPLGSKAQALNKKTVYGLTLIAFFLLVLGCINFINLTTAHGSQRGKEIGIRKTMGSSRLQIVTQLLSETLIITLFAVVIAVAICPLMLKLFVDFIPSGVHVSMLLRPGIVIFLILLTLVVSLLSGFYPAIILSNYKPVSVLKNQLYNSSGNRGNSFLRKSLTVLQFIVAQFFLMITLLISKQIYYILHKDLGFKKEAIICIYTPFKDSASAKQVFVNKIKSLPAVEITSIGSEPPSSESYSSTDCVYNDGKKVIKIAIELKYGDENYLKLYQIKLLGGRNINSTDGKDVIIVNNTLTKILGFKRPQDAIGAIINYDDKEKKKVIGVVNDFYEKSLRETIQPVAIAPPVPPINGLTVHIGLVPDISNGGKWKEGIDGIHKAWKEIYPAEDFQCFFVDEKIASYYSAEQRTTKLLNWATGLSILISCLGLVGLSLYTTTLRTKEIGVRKVLGATVIQIVVFLSKELMWLILFSFILVCPVAWIMMNNWIQGFAYRTTISWWIFAVSGAGTLLTAFITLGFQTIRSAVANPTKSLRND